MKLQRYLDTGEWDYEVRQRYQADMYHVRNGLVINGDASWVDVEKQKPFHNDKGERYDLSMWIDSDMVFEPEDFEKTYKTLISYEEADMVTGFYLMQTSEDVKQTVVGCFGEGENAGKSEHYLLDGVRKFAEEEKEYDLMPVDFSGFGWVLIKTKVFESMTYPYFLSAPTTRGNIKTFPTSDIYFFKKAKANGYKLFAHPRVILGHEKKVVLK